MLHMLGPDLRPPFWNQRHDGLLHSMPVASAAVPQITWHATTTLSTVLPPTRMPWQCTLTTGEPALQALRRRSLAWLSVK